MKHLIQILELTMILAKLIFHHCIYLYHSNSVSVSDSDVAQEAHSKTCSQMQTNFNKHLHHFRRAQLLIGQRRGTYKGKKVENLQWW